MFGYAIKYNNPENTSLSTGRFNGNIAEIDWRTSTVANNRRYSFTYDRFNRLQQGIYSEPGSSVINNNNYNEQLTYDLNGNILTLKRFSKPYSGTTPKEGLSQLKTMLDTYQEPELYKNKYDDAVILDDPNWQEIVRKTKKIVDYLNIK